MGAARRTHGRVAGVEVEHRRGAERELGRADCVRALREGGGLLIPARAATGTDTPSQPRGVSPAIALVAIRSGSQAASMPKSSSAGADQAPLRRS